MTQPRKFMAEWPAVVPGVGERIAFAEFGNEAHRDNLVRYLTAQFVEAGLDPSRIRRLRRQVIVTPWTEQPRIVDHPDSTPERESEANQ